MSSPTNATGAIQKTSLYPILAVNFVGTLGFSIVLPFLVFLVARFGGNAIIYGVMGATYSAFQLIGAPILGKWSDKYGRRKILLISQLGTLTSWFVFIVAMLLPATTMTEVDSSVLGTFTLTVPLIVLFLARALDGITGGNVSVANAYLADITTEENRSKNFGRMAVSANIGFIVGPAIAGVLGATSAGELLPVMAAALISLVASLIIFYWLPESSPKALETDPESPNVRHMLGQEQKECFKIECKEEISTWEVFKLKNVGWILSIYFLVFLGFNLLYVAFPVHAVKGLDWQLADTGAFFSYFGVMMVLVQGPILSTLSKKIADSVLVICGSALMIIGFLLYTAAATWIIYVGATILAVGNGLMWSSVLSILSRATHQRFQGVVQGVASSCGSLASIIGLLAGGLLYEQLGANIFIISAIVIAIVFVLSLRLPTMMRGTEMAIDCQHLDQVKDVSNNIEGCEKCLKSGDSWVHLRICLTCGHVGCCDSSKNLHATKHFQETGHAVMQSYEPGENWGWCYEEEGYIKFKEKKYQQ